MRWKKITLSEEFLSESVGCGDFNRDGHMDVVAGPYWFEGPDFRVRHEVFEAPPFDPHGYSVTTQPCFVHDFNGDGWPDVFYVIRPPGEKRNYGFHGWGDAVGWEGVWYENPAGRDRPWRPHVVLNNIANEALVWGDVNGDGRPEPVYSSREGYGYAVFDPDAPQEPWTFRLVSKPMRLGLSHGVGIGDIDGNGRTDIVAGDGWWEQPPDPSADGPWTWHEFPFAKRPADVLVFDVDGDGLNDIVTAWDCHRYGLLWYRQVRRGEDIRWDCRQILSPEPDLASDELRISQMHALAPADPKGNGRPGIVTGRRWWAHGPDGDVEADQPAVLYWFELQRDAAGGVTSVPHLVDAESGVGTQVAIAVLNGDGKADIVTSNKKGTFVFFAEEVS